MLSLGLSFFTMATHGVWDLGAWIHALKAPDFAEITDVEQRKAAFFNYLLPVIQQQNEKILLMRSLIKNNQFSTKQRQKLAKKYRLKETSQSALLKAVDIVPASLILAQAAIESSWGRSRFAQRWHNYFGIWCFEPGCGVIPKKRAKNSAHEIATFSSPAKAVEYYLLNINRNAAYTTLRDIRQHKRDHQLPITGIALAEGLANYAEIGYEYVEMVQNVIRQNQLQQYD